MHLIYNSNLKIILYNIKAVKITKNETNKQIIVYALNIVHAVAFCKVFTCHRSLYDRIHMSCITIRIMIATFTPVVPDLPLLPKRGKFNPALGQIYPRATFTPAWCIRGMSFFKFTPAIPLRLVQTSDYGPRRLIISGWAE